MIGTQDTDRNGETFTRTAVKLRSGKVHYARKYEGWGVSPECGGNRASERYFETKADVDCVRCLKLLAAEEAAEAAHQARVEASMMPATGEGDYLPPAAEQAAPAAELRVSVDMQSSTQGVVMGHGADGFQGLVGDDGDGGFYAESPYTDEPWHAGGFETVTVAATALARHHGFTGPVAITVDREYSEAAPVTGRVVIEPEQHENEPEQHENEPEAEQLDTARAALLRQLAEIDARLSRIEDRLAELLPVPAESAPTEVRVVMDSGSVGTARVDGVEFHVFRGLCSWGVIGLGISSDSIDGAVKALARRLGHTRPINVTVVPPMD